MTLGLMKVLNLPGNGKHSITTAKRRDKDLYIRSERSVTLGATRFHKRKRVSLAEDKVGITA